MTSMLKKVMIGLVLLNSLTIASTFFVPSPTREGYVTGKVFLPFHLQSAGRTNVPIPASWSVLIEKCDDTPLRTCKEGSYSVSQQVYDQTHIGDYMQFGEPSMLENTGLRIVLGLVGVAILIIIVNMARDMKEDEGAFTIFLIVIFALASQVFIFFAVKGPIGFI